ncbi:MAG: FMN-binding negative transcriptional regulator, partial [Planctomycetaceae bacterium]|nr:FMN-binding negative transcriptional regulator [Planctomycetaceae bacterium]
ARGLVRRLSSDELAAQVAELSRIHEQRVAGSWEYDGLPVEFQQKMLQGICGFRVTVSQLAAKVKLSQNWTPEDRRNVAGALLKSSDPLDQRVGRLMMETLDVTGSPAAPH